MTGNFSAKLKVQCYGASPTPHLLNTVEFPLFTESHHVQCLVIELLFKSSLITVSEKDKCCIVEILKHKPMKGSDRLLGVGLETVLGLTGCHCLGMSELFSD